MLTRGSLAHVASPAFRASLPERESKETPPRHGDQEPIGPQVLWNTWPAPIGRWPVQTAKTYPVARKGNDLHVQWPWEGSRRKSWPVRVESEVAKTRRRRPQPWCVVCSGRGTLMCERCNGRGRVNRTDLVVLPKGMWPKWCWYCRGSGQACCARCLGTGERRGVIGFHVPPVADPAPGPNGSAAERQRHAGADGTAP